MLPLLLLRAATRLSGNEDSAETYLGALAAP